MRLIPRKADFYKFAYLKCRTFSQWTGEISVYRSLSHNPFENLAFEDWVYLNGDLTNKRILFLWRNEPTVILCFSFKNRNVHLARRKSGGGTVYHDLGNVNLSFFTPRELYNRKENLALIVKVLRERWKLDVEASPRDDILVDGNFKISGSSSKLGRAVAFHHCTLLLDADEHLLKFLLHPSYTDFSSKATQSVKSEVMNLSMKDLSLNFDAVTEAVAQLFCQIYAPGKDVEIKDIDPSREDHFPGITAFKEELQEWKWIYGKTPRFTVTFSTTLSSKHISLKITSYHGLIENVDIQCDEEEMHSLLTDLVSELKGVKFDAGDIEVALLAHVNSASLTVLDRQLCYQLIQWIVHVI
ncbi:lipoyltransferase 1, mitochondrial-like [Orbicella faveolata]|uniref:lipoyltransferase 1, mitochondrial-like n=1 Tax=Orbicella faveolata TaxID=48498 RepID=UPI0009E3D9D5|nr:lipoyltransferase 1, mitochondrial-like [Orbicella faveolata]